MGRKERRIDERSKRIEARKEKILISRQELAAWKEKVSTDTSEFNVEVLMTCFALSLVHLDICDNDRILEVLEHIDFLMGRIINDESTITEYIDEMEEAGVVVKCK